MATDAQSLLTQGNCYACYGASVYQILKLALLAQTSLGVNPANDVTPAGLIAQAKCFPCFSNTDIPKMMELALLAQISGG